MMNLARPETNEYASHFAGYINLVPEEDLLKLMERQTDDLSALLQNLPSEKEEFRYAPGKWSLKEVVGHIVDTERVMSYRALCVARGDKTPLPGFDEAVYMAHGEFGRVSLSELLEDFRLVRQGTLAVLSRLSEEAWQRVGVVNNHTTSVRALGYIIAGHSLHHSSTIKERYLSDKL